MDNFGDIGVCWQLANNYKPNM
ncbi:MAG: elongation factor P maturation arginine rhamnosyltransferase EarP, partial [Moraxellaceae bacterium]|nr:elongation factor P maturation arginine rhamnosyltransferase EarP [Moraxellaceae bacterium]